MPKTSTKQCYGCKQTFLKTELIDYTPIAAKISHSYCPACLKEKQDRERFSDTVCKIFGLKSPGPRIWTERLRLQTAYGYTDDIIINTLEYLYYTKKYKKLSESLALVNPTNVEQMLKQKRKESTKANLFVQAMNSPTVNHIVQVKENNSSLKKNWNPDDWLEDE